MSVTDSPATVSGPGGGPGRAATHPSGVVVRDIDVADDAEIARAHAVIEAATLHERPYAVSWSRQELTVDLRRPVTSEKCIGLVAERDGAIVGAAVIFLPLLDNLTMAWPEVCVHPDATRQGVGTALMTEVLRRARAEGRTQVVLEAAIPLGRRSDHGHRRFLERLGFTLANIEVLRILPIPVDPDRLAHLAAEAARHHTAYRIETHLAPLPEHLQESYCACANQLAVDAPTGEVDFEEEATTPEVYREVIDFLAEQGREMISTVALDGDGRVVAYNDLVVVGGDTENVMQWGTLVAREHRGHRLGMAVKVRGLQELARRHPERRRIHTWNAEQNDHMVAINVELGFEVVEDNASFQLVLED